MRLDFLIQKVENLSVLEEKKLLISILELTTYQSNYQSILKIVHGIYCTCQVLGNNCINI